MENNRERVKRLSHATLANLSLVVFTGILQGITGNKAFLAEQVHDSADTLAHGSRWLAEARGIDQNTPVYRNFRRFTMFALSAFSAYTAARIGLDLLNGIEESTSQSQKFIELGGSVAVAGGNIYAYSQLNAIEEHSFASHDSHHHARTDMIASVGLSACIAADAIGINGAAELGGFAFATYTAVELFPTKDRLEVE